MLADLADGQVMRPKHPDSAEADCMVRDRQPDFFTYDDWLRLDQLEIERGQAIGRPRLKFTRVSEMLAAKASWQ